MVAEIKDAVNGLPPLRAAAIAAVVFLVAGWGARGLTGEAATLPTRVSALEELQRRNDARWLYLACVGQSPDPDQTDPARCEIVLGPEDLALLHSLRRGAP